MKIYIDLDTRKIIEAFDVPNPVTTFTLKRGLQEGVEIVFVRDGIPETHPGGTVIRLTLKEVGKYDQDPAIYQLTSFSGPTDSVYSGTLSTNTDPGNALFNSPDGDDSNDVPSVTLMMAVSWKRPAQSLPRETDQVSCVVWNKIDNGDEVPPTTVLAYLGEPVRALPSVIDYLGGGTTKLDGLETVHAAVPVFYCFNHSTDGMRWYVLRAGTDAEDSPGIIRPDDYDGSTNAKVWESIL